MYAEWLDRQAETGGFYDGLPETDDSRGSEDAVPVESAGLPFGYPDSVAGVLEGIPEPASISIGPSGLYIYVMGSAEDGILVMRASSLEIVGAIAHGDTTGTSDQAAEASRVIRVHPRGEYIYVVDPPGSSICIYDLDDGSLAGVVQVGEGPSDIAFNPAGNRAYVPCPDSDRIFVLE